MMRSNNMLSRFVNPNPGTRSIYEELRDAEYSEDDVEAQAGMMLDEENLRYNDDELEHVDMFNGEESRMTTESTAFLRQPQARQSATGAGRNKSYSRSSKWLSHSPRLIEEEGDDDVPASLLIEGNEVPNLSLPSSPKGKSPKVPKERNQIPTAARAGRDTRTQWEAAQAQQQLHQELPAVGPPRIIQQHGILGTTPRDRAMWRWVNVVNLDNFIKDVYTYYQGNGMWCILLERSLNLLQIIFVAVFMTFLSQCVNYSKIPGSKKLTDPGVLVPQCTKKISGMPNVAIWLFTLSVFFRIYQLLLDYPRLRHMKEFYEHLLGIPDADMQTISWQEIIARIMALRDDNPATAERISSRNRKFIDTQSKQRLDAHDIANRLMRKDNYLIAMFNKEILNLDINLPFLRGRQISADWFLITLDWCIMDLVFNKQGQVQQLILKDTHRKELSKALRNRFLFAGYMHLIVSPLLLIYLVIIYFLKYFNEYQKNPSSIGARQYTSLALWKFREFNEVLHLFRERINMSHPFAARYLEQFPKVKFAHFASFVAFVSGAIVSVLAVASLLDPELFLNFEITHERTVLFYIGILGTLWAFMNGSIPEENAVSSPEYALRNVIEYTRYMPTHWEDKLHSDDVRREFEALYQLKVMVLLNELLSVIFTPLVLWRNLLDCSDQIIDFFREFTVHVDGVGYVCSFAVFDFKQGDGRRGAAQNDDTDVRDNYYSTKHGKMAASYYGFLDNYMLNPKTGVQGHVPPSLRQQFHHHPPAFPGLTSPTLTGGLQTSRVERREKRPVNKNLQQAGRTPRFAAAGAQGSPIQSILLDAHHQPSTSGYGARSGYQNPRARRTTRQNIAEEATEEDDTIGTKLRQMESSSREDTGVAGLGESVWELSPTKTIPADQAASEEAAPDTGVLGMLYQFQKAQTDRKGTHI